MKEFENRKPRILIADDEPLFGRTTAELIRKAGFEVIWVDNGGKAIAELEARPFDLAVVDLNMPGNLNLEFLIECRRKFPEFPLVVLTGRPTLPSAIESVRLGIHDYLLKPIEIEDLVNSLRRALTKPGELREKSPAPASSANSKSGLILGTSPETLRLKDHIRKVSRTSANVLIRGESGTGKELVAREVHDGSRRNQGPFVVIDCSAIPDSLLESTLFGHVKGAFTGATSHRTGLIQAADQGTAFFDEIGELPMSLQAKLLRVIQFGTFLPVGASVEEKANIRIVAATNRNLVSEIESSRFRQDLYYRLAVLEIEMPPLRKRTEDIAILGQAFLTEIAERELTTRKTLSPEAVRILERYPWPGNIRELRNVMERASCLSSTDLIGPEDLPEGISQEISDSPPVFSSFMSLPSLEEDRVILLRSTDFAYLQSLMKKHQGNVTAAAREAGMSRQGFHKCLNRVGLKAEDFRR
ncbi:response regulator [bacterium]|nr:response regulator [bacterium]